MLESVSLQGAGATLKQADINTQVGGKYVLNLLNKRAELEQPEDCAQQARQNKFKLKRLRNITEGN